MKNLVMSIMVKKLISEHSYNEEMKKYSIRGKIMNLVGKNLNNRLALYHWNNK